MYTKRWSSWLRRLSIVLTAAMLFTCMPVSAFADSTVSDSSISADKAVDQTSENAASADTVSAATVSATTISAQTVSSGTVQPAVGSMARTLSAGNVSIVSSDTAFTVKNLSNDNIYVYAISKNVANQTISLNAETIVSGGSAGISSYYDEKGIKYPIMPSSDYILCLSTNLVSNNAFFVSPSLHINVRTPQVKTVSTNIADGSIIRFKAISDRNQRVRLSWAPPREFNTYKYYSLSKLAGDGTTWNIVQNSHGVKMQDKTSRSFTDKMLKDEAGNLSVYKLTCYTKEEHNAGCTAGSGVEYITVAAPYMYYAESLSADSMQYCFSKLAANDNSSFRLEISTIKKDANLEANPVVRSMADLTDNIQYNLSNKVSVDAVRFDYSNSAYPLTADSKYYCRVKAQYTYMNKTYISSGSNILSVKQGTERSEILWITGQNPNDSSEKAHFKDYGTCYRKGYILFTEASNAYKYQLLRCDTQYGRYKVIKTYKAADSRNVIKVTDSFYKDIFGKDVYYIKYNGFTPEKRYYYAVRTLDSKGAASGFGDGFENTTDLDQVQEFETGTVNDKSIVLTWRSDPCARQYLIYRVEGSSSANLAQAKGINPKTTSTLVKVVSNHIALKSASANYCRYKDTGLKVSSYYTYVVRPIYNRTIAANLDYSKIINSEETGYKKYLSASSTA